MSRPDDERREIQDQPPEPETSPENSGPNLVLIYTLLALAIIGAMGFAAMIVWPFYLRR